jgi:2-iminoacetate synthase
MSGIVDVIRERRLDGDRAGWVSALDGVCEEDVAGALSAGGRYSLERLVVLLSPAAGYYLEEMARAARELTVQRFGRAVGLYAPLYVSNYCVNRCVYCGYNASHDYPRRRLSVDEAEAEAEVIAGEGFRHILLVSGEDAEYVTVEYLCAVAGRLRRRFSSIGVEVQPMDREDYARLAAAGVDGVTLYQETYNRETYGQVHAGGPKRDYGRRLETHDRAGQAGMRRLGIGVLLGLGDWRVEALALGEHAAYLMKRYWRSAVSFSFPRLRPAHCAAGNFGHPVEDGALVQMMLALRLCFADAGIVLSTRERAGLRDNMAGLCVTMMSAGSKTNPGGYGGDTGSGEQFAVDDRRSAGEVAAMIRAAGREAVWKDWDAAFTATTDFH